MWIHIFSFWFADYQAPNETCFDSQSDGSCKEIYIPDCVDRTVYCSQLPSPDNANLTVLTQTNSKNFNQLGSSVMLSCPWEDWYFNYSTPINLTSYFYSTNIKNMTLTCNIYGWVNFSYHYRAVVSNTRPARGSNAAREHQEKWRF